MYYFGKPLFLLHHSDTLLHLLTHQRKTRGYCESVNICFYLLSCFTLRKETPNVIELQTLCGFITVISKTALSMKLTFIGDLLIERKGFNGP